VVPDRTPKPILRCIKISASGDEVRIFGTDLEVGLNCVVSAVQVDAEGELVVPAAKLAGIVRESADKVLSVEAADGTCEVKGADSHFTVFGQEASQYPAVPSFEGEADLEVNLENLQAGIEQVIFATAKESTRYAINGVLWEVKGKKLSLVATDGRRLARSRVNVSKVSEKMSAAKIIVPAKTMALLGKLGGGGKDTVAVKLVENRVLLSSGNTTISSNLVEGNFPKYEDIIPGDYTKKLTLPTQLVLSAVRRAALLTSEESRGIKVSVGKGQVVFTAKAPEAGDAEVDLQVDYSGEPVEIGFNPQFLTDVLRVISDEQFEMELGQADTPGVIKSGSQFLYVLMPINLG
jgi:DNA polymerase-3 subunit beta